MPRVKDARIRPLKLGPPKLAWPLGEPLQHRSKLRFRQPRAHHARTAVGKDIERELKKLLEALKAEGPMETTIEEMKATGVRKAVLANEPGSADNPPPLLHPNKAGIYRERTDNPYKALNDEVGRSAAAEIIRTLIEEIVVAPQTRTVSVELRSSVGNGYW